MPLNGYQEGLRGGWTRHEVGNSLFNGLPPTVDIPPRPLCYTGPWPPVVTIHPTKQLQYEKRAEYFALKHGDKAHAARILSQKRLAAQKLKRQTRIGMQAQRQFIAYCIWKKRHDEEKEEAAIDAVLESNQSCFLLTEKL